MQIETGKRIRLKKAPLLGVCGLLRVRDDDVEADDVKIGCACCLFDERNERGVDIPAMFAVATARAGAASVRERKLCSLGKDRIACVPPPTNKPFVNGVE